MLNTTDSIDVTVEKLRLLEQTYEETRIESGGSDRSRELTLRSLKRLINQLKEELARSESRSKCGT